MIEKKGSSSMVVSCDKSDLDNPSLIGSKSSERAVSDDKSDFDKYSSIMNDEKTVHQ